MSSSSSNKTELITVYKSTVQRTEEIRDVNKETVVSVGNLAGQISSADKSLCQNLRTNTDRYGDDVDKLAEEFIAKFHQNLELERLRSLERYQKMLRRGV